MHSQCFDGNAPLEAVTDCVSSAHNVLVLMRGLPGSGKSHCANQILSCCPSTEDGAIFSTDDCFMLSDGSYHFDPIKLPEYHKRNQQLVVDALQQNMKTVIVDNTNINFEHIKFYVLQAVKNKYEVYIVEPNTSWKSKPYECAKRTLHGVTKEQIDKMLTNMVPITLHNLLFPIKLEIKNRSEGNRSLDNQLNLVDDSTRSASVPINLGQKAVEKNTIIISPAPTWIPQSNYSWKLPAYLDGGITSGLTEDEMAHKSQVFGDSENCVGFSLLPAENKSKILLEYVSRSTQVSDCELILFRLSHQNISSKNGQENEDTVRVAHCMSPTANVTKHRVSQTEDMAGKPDNVDLLLALFPADDAHQLLHVFSLCNQCLDQTVNIMLDSGSIPRRTGRAEVDNPRRFVEDVSHFQSSEYVANFQTEESLVTEKDSVDRTREEQTDACISLELGDQMADHLQRMFGFVTNDELPAAYLNPSQRTVNIPLEFAQELFKHWMATIDSSADISSVSADDDIFVCASASWVSDSFSVNDQLKGDEQYARYCHEHYLAEDQLNESSKKADVNREYTLAERENLSRVTTEFNGVDADVVKRVFDDNDRRVVATRNTLNIYTIGQVAPEPRVHTIYSLTASESTKAQGQREENEKVPSEAECRGARQSAIDCYTRGTEAYEKASKAFRSKQGHVANHYAQEGREWCQMSQEWNRKAFDMILRQREETNSGDVLDLHGLHVKEAIEALKHRLNIFDRPSASTGKRQLRVISGQGTHSLAGAKLKPAIIRYLKQLEYLFTMPNPGEFLIQCK